jgi:hypothetical protein
MHDIETICGAHESLKFEGFSGDGYAVLKAFTLGMDGSYSKYKPVSFSGSYWRSRNYAANPAGETVASIVRAVDDFESLIKDGELLKKHKAKLQSDLNRRKYHPTIVTEYQSALNRLDETGYLNQCLKKVRELKEKYEAIAARHSPVVYAVSVEPQSFEKAGSTEWPDIPAANRERLIEIRPKPGVHVSPDRIAARIDFPNGVDRWLPFFGEILPLPWLVTGDETKGMWDKYRRILGGKVG